MAHQSTLVIRLIFDAAAFAQKFHRVDASSALQWPPDWNKKTSDTNHIRRCCHRSFLRLSKHQGRADGCHLQLPGCAKAFWRLHPQHCPSMNGMSKNASRHGIPVTHDPSRAMVYHHVILDKHISTVELKIVTPWLCLLLLNSEGCSMLTDLPAAVKMA